MAFKLEQDEHVILIARRHWFRPVTETLLLFFSLLVPIAVTSIAYSFPSHLSEFGNLPVLTIVFVLAWLFMVWNIGFVIWTNHYLDVLVITNLHVIDIEQIGLWQREISTLNLEKIQDISSKTDGIVANILDYGDLEIQTAGSITNFIVKGVERPDYIRQQINEQVNNRMERV